MTTYDRDYDVVAQKGWLLKMLDYITFLFRGGNSKNDEL